MPKVLGRLRARRARIAKETIERLDNDSEKGPEAARRFREAAARVFKTKRAVDGH